MLDQAAADAVRKWRFAPYRENGRAVARTYRIEVGFSLKR